MGRYNLKQFLIVLLIAAPAQAQICPASYYSQWGQKGIGDGCTTSGIENVLPEIGAFKNTFTGACDAHDRCYTTLGTTYSECNGNFLSQMRQACNDKFPPYLRPAEYAACHDAANKYYAAVELNAKYNDPLPEFQREARDRGVAMRARVDANQCGATPEGTAIYSAGLIAKVNGLFQTQVGRKPTIYEFFAAVHNVDPAGNQSAWLQGVNDYVSSRRGVVVPSAVVTTTINTNAYPLQYTFSVPNQGKWYLWRAGNYSSYGTSLTVTAPRTGSIKVDGFVAVTNEKGERNMGIISKLITGMSNCGAVLCD